MTRSVYDRDVNHYGLIAERLAPYVGNIRENPAFGEFWDLGVDECFLQSDVLTAEALCRGSAIDWHLISWFDSGSFIERYEDHGVASSRLEAIAYVLFACRNARCNPDALVLSQGDAVLQFGLGGLPCARIEPVVVDAPAHASLVRQAEGTLLGHRLGPAGLLCLHRAMAQWPGLSALQLPHDLLEATRGPASFCAHVPHPHEWLNGARRLLEKCGEPNAPSLRVEMVAAAALGAPGWAELVAFASTRSASMVPWGVFEFGGADEPRTLLGAHTDALNAWPTFARVAALAVQRWGSGELDVEGSRRGPRFAIANTFPRSGNVFKDAEEKFRQPCISLAPLHVEGVFDDPTLLAEVNAAMIEGLPGLERAFGVGVPLVEKQRMVDKWSAMTLFLEEAPWRFSLCDTADPSGSVVIEYVNRAGNRVGEIVFVARHRGSIVWVASEQAYVAFQEYEAHRPCAILRGLSKAAVGKLMACFDQPPPEHQFLDLEDKRRLEALRARPSPLG